MKARCINATNEIQEFYGAQINAAVKRQKEEAAREEEIRRVMSRNGLNTTSINTDGSSATGTDKYGNTHHVTINWK